MDAEATGDALVLRLPREAVFGEIERIPRPARRENLNCCGRNEQQDVYDAFAANIPAEANAVVGLRVSTAIGAFGQTVLMYVTYIGTPVRYRKGWLRAARSGAGQRFACEAAPLAPDAGKV